MRLRLTFTLALALLLGVLLILPATAQEDATFQNPIITSNFPDPHIIEVEGTYYAYATNGSSRNVPTMTSTDLVTWTPGRDAMPALARWVNLSGPDVWAPEVAQVGETFVLYYTARDKSSGRQCLGVAVADAPQGPFRDPREEPFICQVSDGGSIDASPFYDADGTLYLLWKNDGNCCSRATWIYAQALSEDGTGLVGEPVQLFRNDSPWEGGVVEAPQFWLHDDVYYLFYSGNGYAGERYAVGYAACETPLGPCEKAEENPILISDLTERPLVLGPGHQTVIADADGQTWMFYHVWQVTSGGQRTDTRQVWLDRLDWVDGRPVVNGPTRETQPVPATNDE